jgi:hypothetical protein
MKKKKKKKKVKASRLLRKLDLTVLKKAELKQQSDYQGYAKMKK